MLFREAPIGDETEATGTQMKHTFRVGILPETAGGGAGHPVGHKGRYVGCNGQKTLERKQ